MKIPAAPLELDVSIALQTSPGKLVVMKQEGFTKKTERRQKKEPKPKKPKQKKNKTKKPRRKAVCLYSLISEAVMHLKAYLPL